MQYVLRVRNITLCSVSNLDCAPHRRTGWFPPRLERERGNDDGHKPRLCPSKNKGGRARYSGHPTNRGASIPYEFKASLALSIGKRWKGMETERE